MKNRNGQLIWIRKSSALIDHFKIALGMKDSCLPASLKIWFPNPFASIAFFMLIKILAVLRLPFANHCYL